MKALTKVNHISLYTGDTTFESAELLLCSGTGRPSSTGVFSSLFNRVKQIFWTITDYLREDLCRASFLICLSVVALAVSAYNFGFNNKQNIQTYLITMERELEEQRMAESLVRNIAGLDSIFAAFGEGRQGAVVHADALEYSLNISEYFSERRYKSTALEDFYMVKIAAIEDSLRDGLFQAPAAPDRIAFTQAKTNYVLRNYRHDLRLLMDFANEEIARAAQSIEFLETDSRKALVGHVSSYNVLMDFAMQLGLIFLTLCIASIPGLGREVRTGFV